MTIDELTPFGDRILVRPDAKIDTFAGGIIAPQVAPADNPNYYSVSGVVLKLGDGYYEHVYECLNHQCRYQSRRTVGDYCPVCKATQAVAVVDLERHAFDVQVGDRVLFGRFAGKQIEVDEDPRALDSQQPRVLMMRESEIIAIVDGDEELRPGYTAAEFNKASKGLTPEVRTVIR